MQKPLVEKDFLLAKFPGKGGWTYAEIPEVLENKNAPFGWVRVKGRIDSFEFFKYHLMPTGRGTLFLPVKAAIRKKIKKEAGDIVSIVLYEDSSALEIPKELLQCLSMEPKAHSGFLELKESEQKEFIDWIFAAKKEETVAERIVKTINKLLKGEPLRTKKLL